MSSPPGAQPYTISPSGCAPSVFGKTPSWPPLSCRTLATDGPSLRIEVFDPGHRLPVLGASDLDATGGRGLQLVNALCAYLELAQTIESTEPR